MATASATLIYIGNLPDIDTNEANHTVENLSAIYQTYANDEISVVQILQTDANSDRHLQTDSSGQTADTFTYDVGSGSVTNSIDSASRFFANYEDSLGNTQSTAVSVYQLDNGDTFLRLPNNLEIKNITLTGLQSQGFTGMTLGASSSAQVVCFASGMLIEAKFGHCAVENLEVGDLVRTLDHGLQPIRWIRKSDHALDGAQARNMPILISAGALGPDRPSRDLVVSPQHRIFVGGLGQLTDFFEGEVFVAAKALTDLPGIRVMRGKKAVV